MSKQTKDELGYYLPEPVSEMLERIDEAWSALHAVLASIPETRLIEPGVTAKWSVKDLLGHIAFWDAQVIDDIDGYLARTPPLRVDTDQVNRQDSERHADASLAEMRELMESTHLRMRTRLAELDQTDRDMIAVDTWEHYKEHAEEIRAWLAKSAAR